MYISISPFQFFELQKFILYDKKLPKKKIKRKIERIIVLAEGRVNFGNIIF